MKIFVAIPVFDGKLQVQSVKCLLDEQLLAFAGGDEIEFRFLPSCSHPAYGRNQLVEQFLQTDCDKLFFLDSDVTFDAGSLLKLAKYPFEVVAGAYRLKKDLEEYPVIWPEEKELWSNSHGLIEMSSMPTGFMSISREVFEKFRGFYGDRFYFHAGRKFYAYFEMPYVKENLYGEDSYFCKQWRNAGGKVFMDPCLELTHWDFNKPFVGNVGNWLKSRIKE